MSSENETTSGTHGSTASEVGTHVAEKVKAVGADIGAYASDKAGAIKDQARELYDEGAAKAKQFYSQGKHKAKDLEETLEAYVREKPVQSILIAAGVGLALGLLLRR